ncbi:MAG: hypothetical protein AB8B85_10710 [Paracoccaceae bacterium]
MADEEKSFVEEAEEMMRNFLEGGDDDDSGSGAPAEVAGADDADVPADGQVPSDQDDPETPPAGEPASDDGDVPGAAAADAPAEPATPNAADEPAANADVASDTPPATPPVEAPISMTAEEKAAFEQLPPNMKQFVSRRETQRDQHLNSRMQDTAALRNDFEPVQAMFEPYRDKLKETGLTPADYIHQLVNMDMMASADPLGYVAHIVGRLQIDPRHVAAKLGIKDTFGFDDAALPPPPAARPVPQLPNPAQIAQDRELNRLRAESPNSPESQLQAFTSAVNADGSLMYPHVNILANEMAKEPVAEIGLDQAYRNVAQKHGLPLPVSHPAQVLQPQQAAAPQPHPAPAPAPSQEDTIAAAKAKVAKARRASGVAPSTPASPPTPPDTSQMTTAQLLEHNFAQMGADQA